MDSRCSFGERSAGDDGRGAGVHSPGRQRESDGHRPLHGRPHADRSGAREVSLRRPHTRSDHADRRVQGTRTARGPRDRHARGRAGRSLRRHGQGPPALRQGEGALRGRHRRGRRGDDRRDRGAGGRAHRGRLRAASCRQGLRRRHRRRRTARPSRLGGVRGRRGAAPQPQQADIVVSSRFVTDPVQGVPIEPRAIIAQWQGDRVTVWSSTQVPYAARSGVSHVLQIPESHVRVVVPLLGGGFGAKCDFHFEGHVAALARAAGRPVKLVFSRREEFVAVGHRREGMVIELETGARKDGTLVARRGRLVLDKGAYCGEGGFFAQMAAMHALGPYEIETVNLESFLNYSTNQPSSSIRAPTAPQVCWALEQHMDELAEALGMDPVDLRRRTLVEEGSETPTGQKLERVAMKETLEKAVELIGYGQELPADEAIGVACGWWPCFSANAGAYVKLNPDGSGTIVTGAQENGTGAVMAMPAFVAAELGMKPEDFSMLYQDTDAAPWDMGSCGSQTTFNSGRAVIAAAADLRDQLLGAAADQLEAAREDLELVDGSVRVKGSPEKTVTIVDLAGSGTFHGKGAGELPEGPSAPAEGCLGRLGLESFHAPQLIAHAARVKVDRETGVVRVLHVAAAHDCGKILNRIGADGQVYGGVVMGIGQALSEGTQLDDDGRHRNAHLLDYKLVTASDAPQIDVAWIETDTPNAGPKGSKGVGEPPCVPTAGAIANAVAKVVGTRVRALPMTPERVWEAATE
ncbi:MAG: hypothetical protein E6G14_07760 [Actinobacteria bacterium]|nr:MAG: hypothetical protein E6G14_07760 [Actinomycetota bacterium]